MKKVCAIICEYDPFHNGHKYQIQRARDISGCECILCLMSGSFVQRGYPAIVDKYARTQMALGSGADMVILLPTVFATSSANIFARGAIGMLGSLPFVSHLCFGIEPTSMDIVSTVERLDLDAISALSAELSRSGISSATAYQQSVATLYGEETATLLGKPNAILALEYLTALQRTNSCIIPLAIERNTDYNSNTLSSPVSSASAIRNAISNNKLTDIQSDIPYSLDMLSNRPDTHCFKAILSANLKDISIDTLSTISGITEGLGYRLKLATRTNSNYDDIIASAKTKRYLHSRLRRVMLQAYLGITKQDIDTALDNNIAFYKILGIQRQHSDLLSYMPKGTILRVKDIDDCAVPTKRLADIEVLADNLYSVLANLPYDLFNGHDIIKI